MKIKTHKRFIYLSCYINELIHINLIKFFNFNVYKIQCHIVFSNDWFKRFKIYFFQIERTTFLKFSKVIKRFMNIKTVAFDNCEIMIKVNIIITLFTSVFLKEIFNKSL